ncbi:MAG TPA: hypothetical protein VN924_28375 [Bryobacteraceae bacterium]|nr:hypothetical protein [Bryobacteraceae bacterium]
MLPNRYKGKLIVAEGIAGSGKRTQISLLSRWLRAQGYATASSEWNSSPPVKETIERGKANLSFTPTTFSLIQATDFADRMESYILPLIKAGAVVCADGYAYTAFARDLAHGAGRHWVRNLYSCALRPSLTLYFRVPLDVAIGRLGHNTDESFRILQGRTLAEYEAMAGEMEFHAIDATLSTEEQQRRIRQTVVDCLGEVLRTGVLRSAPKGGPQGSPHGSPQGSPQGSDATATAAAVL